LAVKGHFLKTKHPAIASCLVSQIRTPESTGVSN